MKTLKGAIILNIIAGVLFSVNIFVSIQNGEKAYVNAALSFFFFISAFFYWRRYKRKPEN
jgi:uncharacterized membrane protein